MSEDSLHNRNSNWIRQQVLKPLHTGGLPACEDRDPEGVFSQTGGMKLLSVRMYAVRPPWYVGERCECSALFSNKGYQLRVGSPHSDHDTQPSFSLRLDNSFFISVIHSRCSCNALAWSEIIARSDCISRPCASFSLESHPSNC